MESASLAQGIQLEIKPYAQLNLSRWKIVDNSRWGTEVGRQNIPVEIPKIIPIKQVEGFNQNFQPRLFNIEDFRSPRINGP